MSEEKPITFTHKELAEILVKHAGIKDGIWGLYVKFGIQAVHAGPDDDNLSPTAVIPIYNLGLQRFPKENSLSVDAGKVWQPPVRKRQRAKKKTTRRKDLSG